VRDFAVSVHARRRYSGLRAEKRNQLFQRVQLPLRWRAAFEIADQANADAVLIEEVVRPVHAEIAARAGLAVRSRVLLLPPRAGEHLAICVVHAVADHKVISKTVVPSARVAVIFVHAAG